jgi:hypothetical protein
MRNPAALTGTDDEQSDIGLLVDPAETTSLLTLAAFKFNGKESGGQALQLCHVALQTEEAI